MNVPRPWLPLLLALIPGSICIALFLYADFLIELLQSSNLPKFSGLHFTQDFSYNRFIIIRFLIIFYGFALITLFRSRIITFAKTFFNKNHIAITILSFIIFTAFVMNFFSGGNFFTEPILQDDYAVHYADAVEQAAHLKNNGKLWGYTPFFCSGMISFGIDTLWPTLFILLLQGFASEALAFNLSIFASFIAPSVLLFLTANNFNFTKQQRSFLIILNLIIVTGMSPLFQFFAYGCNGFVLSSYICVYVLSITIRSIYELRISNCISLLVSGLFLAILHPLGAFAFILIFLPVPIIYKKQICRRHFYLWASGLVIAAIISSTWFIPFLTVSPGKDLLVHAYLQTTPALLFTTILKNKPFAILLILATLSIFINYRRTEHNRKLLMEPVLFATGTICLGLIAFYGSQIGFASTQPMRFIIPQIIMLTLLVSTAPQHSQSIGTVRFVLIFAFILIADPRPHRFIYKSQYPAEIQKIFSYLSTNKDNRRLLIQDSDKHPYCYTHISSWTPHGTGLETTAHPYTGLKPKFTQFVGDTLFGQKLNTLSPMDLKRYISLYNIGWILVYSDSARTFFDRQDSITPVISNQISHLYNVQSMETDCWKGSAEVVATYDHISVNNSLSDTLILKYHFFKYLKVHPSDVSIDGVYLQNDPTPFIRLTNSKGNSTVILR